MDLPTLIEKYHDEDACRELLEKLRWPDGPVCNRCEATGDRIGKVSTRDLFRCNDCGNQFSVRVGTVLQDSKLPLWKWFLATYLIVESRKGISSNQLKRTLGVTYKTAWFLTHRVRSAMGQVYQAPLTGVVEADETYIGGKRNDGKGKKNLRGPLADKAIVLGVIERGGEIRVKVAGGTDRKTLHGFIRDHIDDETEAIYTDGHYSYRGVGDHNTRHESVNHRRDEWVRGDVHTNTVESAWSLFKRSLVGSYHQLSARHLPAYLDEFEWRFNNRDNPSLFKDTLRVIVTADPLTYEELVS